MAGGDSSGSSEPPGPPPAFLAGGIGRWWRWGRGDGPRHSWGRVAPNAGSRFLEFREFSTSARTQLLVPRKPCECTTVQTTGSSGTSGSTGITTTQLGRICGHATSPLPQIQVGSSGTQNEICLGNRWLAVGSYPV